MISFQKVPDLLDKLDGLTKKYPEVSFYIGGKGVWKYTEIVKPKHMTISYKIEDIV